ncbi:methylenetetrahydrofolate reduct [Dentipellis sp. KUC8613]|nr:methylenetetrahydrofolate reduct [Dentipellis sp. KUC8613]
MKLAEKFASSERPFYTLEFFPPRTDQGFGNLISRISRLAELKPIGVSITWGAGGSTRARSLELAAVTQKDLGLDTIVHVTCTNMEMGVVDETLRAVKDSGVQTILALRGDPPRGKESWIPTDPRFDHAIDLVKYIRAHPEFSDWFSIGVAAYPDGHSDHVLTEDEELGYLKDKVDAGADFIITQLFYDVDNFLRWEGKVRERGIKVPIIPGIMPIQTYASFLRLTKLCGTSIPPFLEKDLDAIKHDDAKVKDYGVSLAISMVKRLVNEGGIRGFHFCTLNLEKSVQRIIESLDWAQAPSINQTPNRLIADTPGVVESASNDPAHTVTPATATTSATSGLAMHAAREGEIGKGEANSAATWDEFPNGRFGDVNSPAFGSQDLWGGFSSLHSSTLSQWPRPKSVADITDICMRFLTSETTSYPFSPSPLSTESQRILPQLKRLARLGWWSVGSQPAVDGEPSEDPVIGWGPTGGYVFQKPFIEFFADEDVVKRLEKKVKEKGKGWVDYLAANFEGGFKSNVQEGQRNAVTWGVFPGQEIIQSTIIEQESFLTWKEEAFSIWTEWASLYPPKSQERELLEGIRNSRWLINVTHHDYKDPEGLWNFLFEDTPEAPGSGEQ